MVDASVVNLAELIVLTIGVSIAIYELRNIGKNRKLELLLKHTEMLHAGEMPIKYTDAIGQQFDTYEEWQEKYGPLANPEAYSSLMTLVGYTNTYGLILKEGLLEADLLYQLWTPTTALSVWHRAEPVIKAWREKYKDHNLYAPFEDLVEDIKRRYPEIILR